MVGKFSEFWENYRFFGSQKDSTSLFDATKMQHNYAFLTFSELTDLSAIQISFKFLNFSAYNGAFDLCF